MKKKITKNDFEKNHFYFIRLKAKALEERGFTEKGVKLYRDAVVQVLEIDSRHYKAGFEMIVCRSGINVDNGMFRMQFQVGDVEMIEEIFCPFD